MKQISFLLGLLAAVCLPMHAQMDASIKLNEVMTDNQSSLIDEYGTRHAWVEIANISHSTYNIRGMYLTTDRSVLDKSMSVPERVKRMSIIPNGDARTNLSGRQLIVFQLNSQPAKGALHLAVKVDPSKPTWIALYNGNATQLIDSITVPVLAADQSFARISNNGTRADWEVKSADRVTPGIQNQTVVSESKIEKFKREDPHGFGMAIMAMGIVFFCLALLFVFFSLFGRFMARKSDMQKAQEKISRQAATIEAAQKAEAAFKSRQSNVANKEIYLAVIAMALKQYQDDAHDIESGIITINPKHSKWTRI